MNKIPISHELRVHKATVFSQSDTYYSSMFIGHNDKVIATLHVDEAMCNKVDVSNWLNLMAEEILL